MSVRYLDGRRVVDEERVILDAPDPDAGRASLPEGEGVFVASDWLGPDEQS